MKRFILAVSLFLIWNPVAQAQAPFIRARPSPSSLDRRREICSISMSVLSAQFLVKHIPGNPDVIVQNMPGAGHMVAANYVYNIAKPDGLTSLGPSRPSIDQLVGQPEVKYDWSKFTWIGNAGKSPMLYICDPTALTRPSTTFATQRNLPDAVAPASLIPVTSCPNSSRKPSGQNSMLYSATRVAVPLTWQWRGARWCAAPLPSRLTSREPFHSWRQKGFVRILVQGENQG